MTKIITIGQQKGGAGKTTIAAHLAISLSQNRQKVACIDIDPQSSFTNWYSLREERFGREYTGIDFISSTGWRIESAIRDLKNSDNRYDYIIIDAPPHTETETKTAIRLSDLVIVPMQATPTDFWATKSTMDFSHQEEVPAIILLNRLNPVSKLSKDIISKIKKDKENLYAMFKSFLGNRVAFSSCFLSGMTVTETHPKSVSSDEVRNLTKEVIATLFPKQVTPKGSSDIAIKGKQKDRKIKEEVL